MVQISTWVLLEISPVGNSILGQLTFACISGAALCLVTLLAK